jgi:hypothetical protein
VDSEAEFLFVAADSVLEAADREGAIPFDAKEVELGHQDGHCSFVSIIEKYGLKDPALLAMAEVVNAADTGQMESNPYAAGIEAIARGYSLRFPDDLENLEHQFEVYDALCVPPVEDRGREEVAALRCGTPSAGSGPFSA